jgi:hypothetical protein
MDSIWPNLRQMKYSIALICVLLLPSCKSKFTDKSYLLRATKDDNYAFRELRLYEDSTFEFLLYIRDSVKTRLEAGRYFINGDTLNLQYSSKLLKDNTSQMFISGKALYSPFVTDVEAMHIEINKLPQSYSNHTP